MHAPIPVMYSAGWNTWFTCSYCHFLMDVHLKCVSVYTITIIISSLLYGTLKGTDTCMILTMYVVLTLAIFIVHLLIRI